MSDKMQKVICFNGYRTKCSKQDVKQTKAIYKRQMMEMLVGRRCKLNQFNNYVLMLRILKCTNHSIQFTILIIRHSLSPQCLELTKVYNCICCMLSIGQTIFLNFTRIIVRLSQEKFKLDKTLFQQIFGGYSCL